MDAGRKLDALIAEKVFGMDLVSMKSIEPNDGALLFLVKGGWLRIPAYSTDIAAAWQIVESFLADGSAPGLVHNDFGMWAFALDGVQNLPDSCENEDGGPIAFDCMTTFFVEKDMWAPTAPLAICIGALNSLEGSDS